MKPKTPLQYPIYEENRFLRISDVINITRLSRSSIYALAAEGRFPKSLSLVPGGSSRAWLQSEIQEWIDQRIQERDQETANG